MSETQSDWNGLAEQLHEQGDVPEMRAKVVALLAQGHTHSEVADQLDIEHRANVAVHVGRYREERDEAVWLAEHGPEI